MSLPNIQERSGVLHGCPGVVGRPFGCPGLVERLSLMSGSGQETLLNVWEWYEAIPDVRKASWLSGSGREVLPDVRKCSEKPP